MSVFENCKELREIAINSAVIPSGSFSGCVKLESVTIGRDVAVIGEHAFRNTALKSFTVAEGNTAFKPQSGKPYLLSEDGKTLLLCAPTAESVEAPASVTAVGDGAFSGNPDLKSVKLPGVTRLGNYAFALCEDLSSVELGQLTYIGDHAFSGTALTETPDLSKVTYVGDGSFRNTSVKSVTVADGTEIGKNAFRGCKHLESVKLGNNVKVGDYAFALDLTDNWTYDYYRLPDNTRVYFYVYTSPLHSLTIGEGAKLGAGAFYGAAELTEVTLGKNAEIGSHAFYNASRLEKIDLSKVVSIGELAFSGDQTYEFLDSAFTVTATDEDGAYRYHYHTPVFQSIDLSSAEKVGRGAFSYIATLKSVKLGEKLTEIADAAFYMSTSLSDISFAKIERIGENAFGETALVSIDLSSVKEIGESAFAFVDTLKSVKLADGVRIGRGAFGYTPELTKLENDANIARVDDYAFAYSAIRAIDLTGAEYIGTYAFIKEERTPFTVKLGEKLTGIGDNPFAMCDIAPFSKVNVTEFNGKNYEETVFDFDLSETVTVIAGSLYRRVPNGLELITYAGEGKNAVVADETVRLSAMSFAGSDVKSVSLPKELNAIGHKAFYACESLTLVTFESYEAPVLEEEFD